MGQHSSVFGQFLKLVPRYEFDKLSKVHHRGGKLRSMTRWSQFVALSLGQLAGRHSLRDIETNLAVQGRRLYHLGLGPVARSSLARVNERQPHELYQALFDSLYRQRGIDCERGVDRERSLDGQCAFRQFAVIRPCLRPGFGHEHR